MNKERAHTILYDHAVGRIQHLNQGLCPDIVEDHKTRDYECEVCKALTVIDSADHPQETQALLKECQEIAKTSPINAIKRYRERSGCGLKEARDLVMPGFKASA